MRPLNQSLNSSIVNITANLKCLLFSACYLFCFVAFVPLAAQPKAAVTLGKKPLNVLIIAVDDLRPELGCYGQSSIISPNIDKLASQAMLFNRAYCQQALCSPSRTSLLTGLRPDVTRVTDLTTHFRKTIPQAVTLPQYFKQNGYHALSMGKIFHNGLDDSLSWSEPSWWPRPRPDNYVNKESMALLKTKQRVPVYESADVPDNTYLDGMMADHALEVLKTLKNNQKPFFMAVGFSKPHLPFVAPKKYWDLYKSEDIKLADNPFYPENMPQIAANNFGEMKASYIVPADVIPDTLARKLRHGYYACVSYTDAQVGKILRQLDQLGLRQNTIIVLWGDHGFKLGEHKDWGKHTNFELDTRVPLLVSYPGMKQKGKKTDGLVELIDVYPSLCQLAGLPIPATLQGLSFVPLIENPGRLWKQAAFSQHPREWYKRDIYPKHDVLGYSIRTGQYRFTRWQRGPVNKPEEVIALELYDHQKDDNENVNLAGKPEYAAIVKQLTIMLNKGSTEVLLKKG